VGIVIKTLAEQGEPTDGLNALRAKLDSAKRHGTTVLQQLDGEEIRLQVAAGVADGFALVLSDDKLVKAFWHKGYQELANHSAAGASQWIGKRIFTTAVLAMTTAGVIWLIRNGALK